jgi:hypothetical protein
VADTVEGVVTVVSPDLLAVGARWVDGPRSGDWIAERLGPFGGTVGHAVPLGYPAYAIVPIPFEDASGYVRLLVTDALVDVLRPFTGDQFVHCGVWDGWPWWYPTGGDPRRPQGTAVRVAWPEGASPTQAEIDRALYEARERLAAGSVEFPDAQPLELPHRRYYLWTGPLHSVTALRDKWEDPPSVAWPEDRSWFLGAPIWTNEIAVGGTKPLIDAVISDPRLNARHATRDEELDIDD